MSTDIKLATIALRDKAWAAVLATQEYAFFKALDEAATAIGGTSLTGGLASLPPSAWLPKAAPPAAQVMAGALRDYGSKRLSQTAAAALVLRETGEPLPIGRLLEKVIARGVVFRGEDPMPSFRSALSKDSALKSVMRNGMYFWWFTNEELPEGWREAVDPDLPGLSTASNSDNQEGGDGHAANNTNLAS